MISEGNVFNKKYKIIRQLGQGGMAQVWLAEEVKMGNRQVAIKVPLPGMSEDENRILQARFQREVKVCAELAKAYTPNIVKALTVEPYEDGDLLVMEYMPGGDLAQKISDNPEGVPIEDAIKISKEILTALDAIHNHPRAIIHRDIKPSNILFNSKSEACLGDFGLAQIAQTSGILSQVINGQALIFTPRYRAPELSSPGAYANATVDIFSFGCTLWEMLTGKVYKDHRPGTPPSEMNAEVPEWLDEVSTRCLKNDFWDRWKTVAEIIPALQENQIEKKQPVSQKKESNQITKRKTEISISKKVSKKPAKKVKTTPSLGIGSTMVSEKDGRTMVYVPEGEFLMGSEENDTDPYESEKPQHSVYLDAYWIDQTPVTNTMFAKFLNEWENREEKNTYWFDFESSYAKISQSKGVWQVKKGFEDHPVVKVNWYGARAYCQWAGKRLPTEAEWEKAARGSDGRTYPWGEGISCRLANFDECYEFPETSPVGHHPKGASPYGALDMAGNVWEWVGDWFDEDYYKKSPDKNPKGSASGEDRVLRGGSWYNNEWNTRSVNRNYNTPDYTYYNIGFRCATSP